MSSGPLSSVKQASYIGQQGDSFQQCFPNLNKNTNVVVATSYLPHCQERDYCYC